MMIKKTFKPMARAEKASHMYKKKTLNLTDDLNIKHDADDLENVDEYWDAAASVIGNETVDTLEDTVVTEQSDTLFDLKTIRRSIKDSTTAGPTVYANAQQGLPEKAAARTADPGKIIAKKRLTLKCEGNDSDEVVNMDELEGKENTRAGQAAQDGKGAETADASEPGPAPSEAEAPEPVFVETGSGIFEIASDDALPAAEVKHSKAKVETAKQMVRSKMIFKSSKPARKEADTRKDLGVRTLMVRDVKKAGTMNKVRPLVCTSAIDTAIMELDHMAHIESERSDKAFSIFVIKGQVDIQTGSASAVIKKGEATVIGEGAIYSMTCVSTGGASLFLSYAL
ncbi:hypothetical protein PAPHI01_0287 [Pancytospora philotis]|nr:hypothetical protein PAPHI01_0287 [Pancytospora philotis]